MLCSLSLQQSLIPASLDRITEDIRTGLALLFSFPPLDRHCSDQIGFSFPLGRRGGGTEGVTEAQPS